MFCRCSNKIALKNTNNNTDKQERLEEPNTRVCPVCMGFPGVLPKINMQAIKWAIKTALALNCRVAKETKFDRKSYFYPDLPKGYQISQYDMPLAEGGYLDIDVPLSKIKDQKSKIKNNMSTRRIKITRLHMEEDAAKLIHPEVADYSLVDFNRAGTPLMEIVTEPDLRSPLEAKIFMQELRSILRYLDVSEGDMEEGNLRCDANISLSPKLKVKSGKLGEKVEIKNINSFKAVERALTYEEERQKEVLEGGGRIEQETRGWMENKGRTISQRGKEEAEDYRYFPEPDLPPLKFKKEQIEGIQLQLPELPNQRQRRFVKEYDLSMYDAQILTGDIEIADFFEKSLQNIPKMDKQKAKKVCNWITTELQYLIKDKNIDITECKIKPKDLAELITLIDKGEISGKIAKEIFVEMFNTGKSPSQIVSKEGLKQVSDEGQLAKIIQKVISKNQKAVSDYKKGKQQAFKFLVGQVMAQTRGQANPQMVNKILREKLK
jgi:aspartyl-tRNA(Asn)/glutamyl-tRNA(Gln) amidotransferase subunit B